MQPPSPLSRPSPPIPNKENNAAPPTPFSPLPRRGPSFDPNPSADTPPTTPPRLLNLGLLILGHYALTHRRVSKDLIASVDQLSLRVQSGASRTAVLRVQRKEGRAGEILAIAGPVGLDGGVGVKDKGICGSPTRSDTKCEESQKESGTGNGNVNLNATAMSEREKRIDVLAQDEWEVVRLIIEMKTDTPLHDNRSLPLSQSSPSPGEWTWVAELHVIAHVSEKWPSPPLPSQSTPTLAASSHESGHPQQSEAAPTRTIQTSIHARDVGIWRLATDPEVWYDCSTPRYLDYQNTSGLSSASSLAMMRGPDEKVDLNLSIPLTVEAVDGIIQRMVRCMSEARQCEVNGDEDVPAFKRALEGAVGEIEKRSQRVGCGRITSRLKLVDSGQGTEAGDDANGVRKRTAIVMLSVQLALYVEEDVSAGKGEVEAGAGDKVRDKDEGGWNNQEKKPAAIICWDGASLGKVPRVGVVFAEHPGIRRLYGPTFEF